MKAEVKPVFCIAVDGPAGAGKTTLARALAAAYDFACLETGALYRLAARAVLQAGGDPAREEDAAKAARTLDKKALAGLPEADLARAEIAAAASLVAAHPSVRRAILPLQRDFARNGGFSNKKGVVLEGRDIGSVVLPAAAVKIFITADIAARGARRNKDLAADETPAQTARALLQRDQRDRERAAAPLRHAAGAHLLDSSKKTKRETLAAAKALVEAHPAFPL